MALTHLLDTSVYCQPLKPRPLAGVQQRWHTLGDEALATSAACEAELCYGLELKKSARLNSVYQSLLENRLTLLPIDGAVARVFGQIKAAARKKGFAASDLDFLIAATAKVHGLVLATLNVRHFDQIEGLAVEDWSAS